MIEIFKKNKRLLLKYTPRYSDENWIDEKLKEHGEITIIRIFDFLPEHLTDALEPTGWESSGKTFILGTVLDGYYQIDLEILGLQYDLLLDKDMNITDKTFVAAGRVSIFRKIDRLVKEQIVVGGSRENAIPVDDFENLLRVFPTKTTLDHYASSRITGILKDYLGTITDAQKKLEDHLKRQGSIKAVPKIDALYKYEAEKYIYIRDRLIDMLKDSDSYSEDNWQKLMLEFLLLLFPKYVAILENVHIKDYYSKRDTISDRYIDLTLIDANGNIDIIEIKKPFSNCLLSNSKYRDNYTPRKELSGSVMQAEKYLFHLNKWGAEGEKRINEKRSKDIPQGMKIKVTNPKAIIVLGRDNDFEENQLFDFEIIKRKYANIMDIMTYDDLLRRLENIITRFKATS